MLAVRQCADLDRALEHAPCTFGIASQEQLLADIEPGLGQIEPFHLLVLARRAQQIVLRHASGQIVDHRAGPALAVGLADEGRDRVAALATVALRRQEEPDQREVAVLAAGLLRRFAE